MPVTNLHQIVLPFWPFAEFASCARCGRPVATVRAVAVVDAGILAGMAHENCDETPHSRGTTETTGGNR